jgi:hypothetical protein
MIKPIKTPQLERIGRIRNLAKFIIEDNNGKATISDIYRFVYKNWGFRFRKATVDGYIKALLSTGLFALNDDHVIYTKKKEKEEV